MTFDKLLTKLAPLEKKLRKRLMDLDEKEIIFSQIASELKKFYTHCGV